MFPEYLFPCTYSATFVFLQSLKKKSDFLLVGILLFVLNAQLGHAGCILYSAIIKWFSVILMKQEAGWLCGRCIGLVQLGFVLFSVSVVANR